MATGAATYLKNIGKSVGYSMIDTIKDSAPAMTAFASNNGDAIKSTYQAIRHMDKTVKQMKVKILQSEYGDVGRYALANIKDDLRSGKFYNLERKRSGDTEALKDLGFGEDDDFGFEDLANMDNFDMDGGESLESMVDLVGKKASEAVSDAVIRTTEYAVNAQTELTRATAEQNKAIYANLHSAIGTVNENIGKLIEIANGPMTTHFENSQKFFEAETKLSEERNAILREMLELQRGVYAPKNKKPVDGKISMADIMDEHGMPDLSTYFEAVKKNIDNLSAGTGDLIKSMLTPDMLKSLVSSPLQFATDFVAKQLFPNLIKESVKNLDKTVSGAFSSIMAKVMNTEFEGALPNFLKSILGIADNTKTNIDTSKYEKGAVPFDGITRKSIVEVIPTYLARIESAITKQTERRFDFESGKFIGVDEIKDIAKSNKGSAERYSNFDVKQYLDRYMKAINFKDSKRRKQVQENIDRILSKSFDTAVLFNPNVRDDLPSDYGMKGDDLDYQLKMIKQMFKAIPKEVVSAYAQNVYEAKGQYSRQMRAKEESGTSIEAALYNNSMRGMVYDRSARAKEQVKKDTSVYRGDRTRSRNRSRRNRRNRGASSSTTTQQSSDDGDPDAAKDAVFTYDAEDYEGLEDGVVAALMVLNDEDKKSSDSKNKSIFQKLQESTAIGAGVKKFVKGIDYLLHKPTEFLAGIIKKADSSIYNLIFGVEYDEETGEKKSISKAIFDGLKETFQDFKDWMRKYVFDPIKKYFDKEGTIGNRAKKFVQGKYKQFKESDFGNRFFATFKNAGTAVKDTAKNAAESIMSGDQNEVSASDILSELLNGNKSSNKKPKLKDIGKSNIDNNAKGSRRVKKTGLAVLSEGEMIIPPDLNPLNIAKRNKKENRIKDDFLSNIPNFGGGKGNFTIIEGGKGKKESTEEASNYAIAEEWNKKMETNLEGAKQEFAQLPRKAQDKIIKALKKYELGEKAGKLVKSVGKQLSSAAKSVYERGKEAWNSDKEQTEEQKKKATQQEKSLKIIAENGFKEIKKYAPEVAAGSIIGGGVSLITGAIGGPLVGAAVGAGISLLKNSEKFNRVLFGTVGEDGKRHGGLLPEKISAAFQKYAPSMGKGAILGGISSFILPFGPLAGIMLGSAAGFAKENEDVHKALFGDEGLFGKDFDKKVKKALPAMGAGALVGAVAGPFGLVPNLILGSAAGLGVTTDKFKDFMFGKEDKDGIRHGGLIENAVQNMFKPMVDFTKNTMKDLKEWADKNIKEPLKHFVDPVKQQFRLIFRSIHEGINGLFKEHLGATMDDLLKETFGHITGFIKKITGWALAPIKTVVSAPFKFLGFVGDNLRDRQIRRGNADDMTAAERNAWRDKRKINSRNLTPMSFLTNMLTHPIRTIKNPIETAKSGVDKAYGKASRVAKQDKALEIMGSNEASDLLEILSLVTADEKAVGGTREAIFDRYTEKVRKSGKLKASQVNRIAKELKPLITSDKIRDAASAKKITQHCIGIINRFDDISDEDKLEFNEEIKTFISSMLEHNQRRAAFKKNKQSIIEKITESKSFQDAGLTADDIKEEDLESLIRRLKKEVQYKTIDSKGDSELKEANEEFNRKYDENSTKIINHLKNIEESLSFLRNVDSTRAESFSEQLDDITDPNATYWSPKEHVINGVKFGARKVKQGVKFGAGKAKQGAKTVKEAVYDSGETIQDVKDKARQNTIDAAKKSKSVEGTGNIIPFPNAAGGGIVDRTGIVAVSEGELIIPPDFSPFNTDKRKKKEDEAKKKFVDSIFGYAEGGEVGDDDSNTKKHPSLFDKLRGFVKNKKDGDENTRYEFNNGRPYKYVKDDKGEWILDKSDSDTANSMREDDKEKEQRQTFFGKMTNMTSELASSIRKAIAGEDDDGKGNVFSFLAKGLGGIATLLTGSKLSKVAAAALGIPTLVGAASWINEKTGFTDNLKKWWEDTGKKALSNIGTGFVNFLTGDGTFEGGGLPSLLQGLGGFWTKGFQVICKDILPAAIKIFVTALPSMVGGLLSGLGELMKMGIGWLKDVFTGNKNIDKEKITLKGNTGNTLFKSSGTKTWTQDVKITSSKSMSLNGDLGDLASGTEEIKDPDYSFSFGGTGGTAGKASIDTYTTSSGSTITTNSTSVSNYIQNQEATGKADKGSISEKEASQTLQRQAIDHLNQSKVNLKDTEGYKEMPKYMQEELYKNFGITRENLQDFITITPPGGQPVTMTLEEFLTSNEKMFPIVREDGTEEVLSPQDLLDPHNRDLAEQFGIDYDISHEERRKNTEEAGLSREMTLGGALAMYTGKKFLKGKTSSKGMKAFANIVGKTPFLGKALRLPFDAAAGISSGAGRLGNFVFSGGKTAGKRAEEAGKRLVTPRQMSKGLGSTSGQFSGKVSDLWSKITGNYDIIDNDVYDELLRMEEAGELKHKKRFGIFDKKDYDWKKNLKQAKKNVKLNAKDTSKSTAESAASAAKHTAKGMGDTATDYAYDIMDAEGNVISSYTPNNSSKTTPLIESKTPLLEDKARSNVKNTVSDTAEKALKEEAEKATGKAGKSILKEAGESLVDGESKGFIAKIQKWALDLCQKFCKDNKIIEYFTKAAEKVGKSKKAATAALSKLSSWLVDKLVPKFIKNLTKKGAAAISKLAGKLFIPVVGAVFTVGSAVLAFIDGYNNADSVFGFTDEVMEPTISMRVIAGVVSAATETVTQGLVPAEFIVQGVMFLLEFFGVNFDDIKEAQVKSNEVLQEYNLTNDEGVELTLDEYNRRNDLTTKLKKGAGKIWDKVKETGSNAWEGIKDFGSNIADKAVNAGSWIKDKAGDLAKGAVDKAKDAGNWLTGNAFNDDEIRRRFGVSEDYEITLQDRVSTFLGSKLEQITGKDFTKEIDGTITRMKDGIKNGLDTMNNKLGSMLGLEDENGNPMSVTEGLKYNFSKGIQSLKKGWDDFSSNTVEFWKGVGSSAKEKWDEFTNGVSTGLKNVNNSIGSLLGFENEDGEPISFTEGVSQKWEDIRKGFSEGWDNFRDNTKEFWTNVGDSAKEKWDEFTEGVGDALSAVNDNLGAMFGMVDEDGNVMSLTEGIGYNWDKFRKGLSDTWSNIKDGAKGLWDKVTGWFTDAGEESAERHAAADPGAKGSGIPRQMMFNGRGSNQKPKSDSKYANDPTFVSQLDSKYANQSFNVQGDTQKQTIADSGCGPAAAAMVVNGAYGGQNQLTMKEASKEALKYKVKNGGVNAAYFEDEFSSHGLMTKYYVDGSKKERNEDISSSLRSGNRVVLMGSDSTNKSKVASPYGPDDHYIVATRMSPDGKYIWINDPESKVPEVKYPAQKVLNSTKMGVAGVAANGSRLVRHIHAKGSGLSSRLRNKLRAYHGRGKYGPDTIQYKVWDGLRSAGFSENATAAAMGNIQHESGFNPSAIEKGSGAGFGLIQWTGGRRTAIENYAASKGVSASDIGLQIEYLIKELRNETGAWMTANTKYGFGPLTQSDWENGDLDTATKAFMCCFERPAYSSSVNHIDRRLESARDYYKEFTGTEPSGNAPSSGGTTGDSSSSGGSILDDILGVFDDLGEIWGLKKKDTSSSGGTSGGSVAASSSLQEALVNKMKSVEGKLAYSQSSRNPDNGSGDCSSTVQWAYKNVLGVDPGSWTGAQETDDDTYTVTNSFDESQMQQGDMILYNGHVEMYAGDGKMIGHGGGSDGTTPGPTIKPLSDQGRFRMIRRWKGFRDGYDSSQIPEQYRSLAGKGSGISKFRSNRAIDPKKMITVDDTYKSSNQKITQNGGFIRRSRYDASMTKDIKIPAGMYAAGTGLDIDGYTLQSKAPNEVIRSTSSTSSASKVVDSATKSRSDKVQAYLAAILKLLAKEVENTNMLSTVVTILTELVKISEEEKELKGKSNTKQKEEELKTRRMSMMNILNATGISNGSSPELEKLINEAQRLAAI